MKYWDKAWQLIDGCTEVSAGCDNCWSAGMTHRFKQDLTDGKGKFNGEIKIREDRLRADTSPLANTGQEVFEH